MSSQAARGSIATPYFGVIAATAPDPRDAFGGGGVQFGKHLVEAAAWRAQDQETRWQITGITVGVALMASAKEETARPDATGRGLSFEFDLNFAAQNIEGFILTGMSVRRRARAGRDHVFP